MPRVLVAEDFDVIRKDLEEKISSREGWSVSAAVATGAEAVAAYAPGKVDLVLMDIEMEGQSSGIEAAEAILESVPSAKIIYLTSHDSDRLVMSAMATGALDYIVKGASGEEIFRRLEAAMKGETTLDAKVGRIVMGEYKRLRKSESALLYFIQHLGNLTPSERELTGRLLAGQKAKEIASARNVEASTVKSQIRTLLHKSECSRTSELVGLIRELGLENLFPRP